MLLQVENIHLFAYFWQGVFLLQNKLDFRNFIFHDCDSYV